MAVTKSKIQSMNDLLSQSKSNQFMPPRKQQHKTTTTTVYLKKIFN